MTRFFSTRLAALVAVLIASCTIWLSCADDSHGSGASGLSNKFKCGGFNPMTVAYPLELVGPTADWITQDYVDSRGMVKVKFARPTGRLKIACDLRGQDPNLGNGEVYVNFKYLKTIVDNQPINLAGTTIDVVADLPSAFVNPNPSTPNGCQVMVKDHQFRSQYGAWGNVTSSGKKTFSLRPTAAPPASYTTDPGFDPSKIIILGFKCGIGDASTDTFDGVISISRINFSNPLPATPLPVLPAGLPADFLKSTSLVQMVNGEFYVGGTKWHVVGGNARLVEFGQNFGATGWFPFGNGVSRHRGYLATLFDLWRKSGVTLIRVGLLEDGRTMFDANHYVIGYDDQFKQDIETLLELAAQFKMKVEFVLVDYQLAGKGQVVDGVLVRGHGDVISLADRRERFFTDFLEPFLREYGSCPVIFGYDIINEGEWVLAQADGGDWESVTDLEVKPDAPLAKAAFDAFVSGCIQRIRLLAPNQFITLGVSFPNLALTSAYDLDYLAPHWYPWMSDGGRPDLAGWIATIPAGKAWMLEEFQSSDPAAVASVYQLVNGLGGAGSLVWNLNAGIDGATAPLGQEGDLYQAIRTAANSF